MGGNRKSRLSVGQIFRLIRLLVEAIGVCVREVEAARQPSSQGGTRVTPEEASAIAVTALSEIADDLADMLQE